MSKFAKGVVAVSVLSASIAASTAAHAELTGNIGLTSNYLWRGVTQTDDQAAISGGIDYAADMGIYVGTWVSNVTWTDPDGYEIDLYAGYAGEAGSVSYDVGVVQYLYPVGDAEDDFAELYGSVGFGPVTATVAYTIDKEADVDNENDIYYSLGAGFDVAEGLGLGAVVGKYDFDDDAIEDYVHYQISLTKSVGDYGDFTFAFDDTDIDDYDPRFSVSWSKGFDLM